MATTYPPKVLDLSFKASIEGSHYDRPTNYLKFEPGQGFRQRMEKLQHEVLDSLEYEWVAVQRNYQSYPSGGESHYASYVYWDRMQLHSAQGNGTIKWENVDFYRVERSEIEQSPLNGEQLDRAITNIDFTIRAHSHYASSSSHVERCQEARQHLLDGTATLLEQWHWHWYGLYPKGLE